MKILHVVTLITPDNRFGGPVTVATNLCAELARQGHDVVLIGAGTLNSESQESGYSRRIFKALPLFGRRSFSALFSIRGLVWFLSHAKSFDVVHIHLARDLVTFPIGILCSILKVPYVVQPHGMVVRDRRANVRAFDRLGLQRVMRKCAMLFALTSLEQTALEELGAAPDAIARLGNGVALPSTWRDAAPATKSSISFVARLEKRKNPMAFVELAALSRDDTSLEFLMAGADQGELASVMAFAERERLDNFQYLGSLSSAQVAALLRESSALVLPSRDEPFPMVVLESVSRGTPVIVTNTCHIADQIRGAGAGQVAQPSASSLKSGLTKILASGVAGRQRARALAERDYSIVAVVNQLVAHYERTVTKSGRE